MATIMVTRVLCPPCHGTAERLGVLNQWIAPDRVESRGGGRVDIWYRGYTIHNCEAIEAGDLGYDID